MYISNMLKRYFHSASSSRMAARGRFHPKLEALEDRWCPAAAIDGYDLAGLGNSPATAIPLGSASQAHPLHFTQSNLSIDSPTDVDYFKFTLTANGGVNDAISANFLNSSG